MKRFFWLTAWVLSVPFLGGAAFTTYDVLGRPNMLTDPESKVAVGWLVTGMMFFGIGMRGWRAHRRRQAAKQIKITEA